MNVTLKCQIKTEKQSKTLSVCNPDQSQNAQDAGDKPRRRLSRIGDGVAAIELEKQQAADENLWPTCYGA